MSRSTKAEVARRVAEIFPLICDCFSLRDIRTIIDAKTPWGASISDSTLKYYAKLARAQLREAARFDRSEEIGAAKRRLERIIARSSAKGELSVELAACRQLSELLGLPAPARSEIRHSGEISLEAKQSLLVEKILKEIAEREGGDHDGKR
jgi:hypothetical protein